MRIAILLVSLFLTNEISACCAEETRCLTEMLITRKSPIYYAKVISSTDKNGEWSAKLKILESFFDANNVDTISIETGGIGWSTGGTLLKEGSMWLIYDGFSICSNFTKQADSTSKFLSELNMLRQFEDVIYNKKSKKINITDSIAGIYLIATFKKGLPNGSFEHYYSSGEIKAKSKYKNGIKEGNWTLYYTNGKVKSDINYENGQLNGRHITYDQTGRTIKDYTFLNNKVTESTTYKYIIKYYSNRTIKEEYTLKNGNSVDGKWNTYYENGKLKSAQLYSENKRIGVKKNYRIDGTEIK
jgi:antitoxin component YwqK of YwqJK toxin-antitoxin module